MCWYQLCGQAAEGVNKKVRLGDCSLPGTGIMVQFSSSSTKRSGLGGHHHLPLTRLCFQVPAVFGERLLRVEGLQPNQKYVFAVAAYNSEGRLLGHAIGGTTAPLLASMPVPLLPAWAHLAQVRRSLL